MKEHKLDNPAWHSLHETHANFSVAYNGIKFYHPDYCPFGGVVNQDLATEGISEYGQLVDNFFGSSSQFGHFLPCTPKGEWLISSK